MKAVSLAQMVEVSISEFTTGTCTGSESPLVCRITPAMEAF